VRCFDVNLQRKPGPCHLRLGGAASVGQRKIECGARNVFARNQAQILSGLQFGAQHFRQGRGQPSFFWTAGQIAKTENGDGTAGRSR